MTYDSQQDGFAFHQQNQLNYPVLMDQEAFHVSRLGILNQDVPKHSKYYGIPHPGIFLVDKNGVIQAKFAESGYRLRPDFNTVLDAAKKMATLANKP